MSTWLKSGEAALLPCASAASLRWINFVLSPLPLSYLEGEGKPSAFFRAFCTHTYNCDVYVEADLSNTGLVEHREPSKVAAGSPARVGSSGLTKPTHV